MSSTDNKNVTVELMDEFINHLYDAREDEQYNGDYSITLTAEGRSITVALNGIDIDLITEDELLIHMNVINIKE